MISMQAISEFYIPPTQVQYTRAKFQLYMRWRVEDEKGAEFRGAPETYSFAPINVCLKSWGKYFKKYMSPPVSVATTNGFSRCFSEGFVKVFCLFVSISHFYNDFKNLR